MDSGTASAKPILPELLHRYHLPLFLFTLMTARLPMNRSAVRRASSACMKWPRLRRSAQGMPTARVRPHMTRRRDVGRSPLYPSAKSTTGNTRRGWCMKAPTRAAVPHVFHASPIAISCRSRLWEPPGNTHVQTASICVDAHSPPLSIRHQSPSHEVGGQGVAMDILSQLTLLEGCRARCFQLGPDEM